MSQSYSECWSNPAEIWSRRVVAGEGQGSEGALVGAARLGNIRFIVSTRGGPSRKDRDRGAESDAFLSPRD